MESYLDKILSEYGAFVGFLFLVIFGLIQAVKVLWAKIEVLLEKLESLSNRFLQTVENNTKIVTRLVEKLDADEE